MKELIAEMDDAVSGVFHYNQPITAESQRLSLVWEKLRLCITQAALASQHAEQIKNSGLPEFDQNPPDGGLRPL